MREESHVTLSLVIIGGVVVVLTAAAKVPTAAAAFLRACIPLIEAFHELRDAIRRRGSAQQDSGNGGESGLAVPPADEQLVRGEHSKHSGVDESR
jgi:hypothetical protein